MGVKLKKEKKFITHGDLVAMTGLLMSFRTPTFGDTERIKNLIALSDDQAGARQEITRKFFVEHNLPENEVIEPTHPLSTKLNIAVLSQASAVSSDKLAVFTQTEFNSAVDGNNFNYGQRSFLQEWLVKD